MSNDSNLGKYIFCINSTITIMWINQFIYIVFQSKDEE